MSAFFALFDFVFVLLGTSSAGVLSAVDSLRLRDGMVIRVGRAAGAAQGDKLLIWEGDGVSTTVAIASVPCASQKK